MSCSLVQNSYGKSMVKVTKVSRTGEHHEIREMSVNIELEGSFVEAYTEGNNTALVATDSMKNTVYVLAAENEVSSPEQFGILLAQHFCQKYPQVKQASVAIVETLWTRIDVNGVPHQHSFTGGSSEKRCANVCVTRDRTTVRSGITGLSVLKTTNSGFVGFVRDRYTTLADTTDRIFATNIDCWWSFERLNVDYNDNYLKVRAAVLKTFAEHNSLGVQQTLHAMGENILNQCAEISDVDITMPNQHRIAFDLSRFNLENKNEIFVSTTEPFGLIKGRIARGTGQADEQHLLAGARKS